MASGDIYQVRLEQAYNGEEVANVFFYQEAASSFVGSAFDLATTFQSAVVNDIRELQVSGVSQNALRVVNGADNTDNAILSPTAPGLRALTGAPTFIAAAFRKRTEAYGFRYSYKRFAGIPITAFDVGGWANIAGTYFGFLNDVAVSLGASLTSLSTGATYEPVQITGGFVLGVAPTFKQFLTGGWQVNDQVSHQDTRQQFSWVNTVA